MKVIHILGIIVVAIAIGVIYTTLQSSSSYSNFTEIEKNPTIEYHVVGKINKSKPIQYNPKVNANLCSFYLVDMQGIERQVNLHKSLPQDIQSAEQIVIIGKLSNNIFNAHSILMKCPSKYNATDKTAK